MKLLVIKTQEKNNHNTTSRTIRDGIETIS